MWPFKRRPLLDDDTVQWHIDNAALVDIEPYRKILVDARDGFLSG